MRKRSTKEIIEATVTSSTTRQKRINQERRRKALEKSVEQQRSADQSKKPDLATAKIRDLEARTEVSKARRDALVAKTERQKELDKRDDQNRDDKDAAARVSSKEKFAKSIAGDKPKLERITSKDKSVSATGKAAMNLAKSATSIGRKVASIPTRMAARKEKQDLGKAQMQKNQAPTSGTTGQKVRYAARPVTRAVSNAATSIRRKTGRGIEKVGKRIIPEDFIHEAENGKKEVKKEKIDVMKGTNKIEVNPKSLPEETMSPAQKRKDTNLKKKYDDSDMKQNMIDQYGEEEGMKVYYATIRKQAMKEAKIDQTMTPAEKRSARNERRTGKKDKPEFGMHTGKLWQKSKVAKWNQNYRQDAHKERRGVKKVKGNMTLKDRVGEMRGMTRPNRLARIAQHAKKIDVTDVKKYKDGSYGGTTEYSHYEPKGPVVMESGLEVQNVSDGLKFREYEFIDVIKNEPMKSPKNNITWTEARDEHGDLVGGPKISKKQLKKNLISNTPDEQHTTTTSEAKMPVKGLVKLAAMVADNNKKRKNALQIQNYIGIGEGIDSESKKSPNEIKPVELKRIAAISGKFTRFPAGEETEKATERKRLKREKIANEETIIERSGKSNQNKRLENDPIVMKYISKNFDEKNRTKAVEQKVKEDAKKSPEKLKRERQMRLMMKGKFKTNRRSRQ